MAHNKVLNFLEIGSKNIKCVAVVLDKENKTKYFRTN